MNADVEKAVERLKNYLSITVDGKHFRSSDYDTIRQALRDQEAEIAACRLDEKRRIAEMVVFMSRLHLAEVKAERAETADALLHELLNGKWCTPEYNDARQRAADHLGGEHG